MNVRANARKRIGRIVRSPRQLTLMFQEFVRFEATGSILLLIAAIVALVWANSPLADLYFDLLHTDIAVHIGPYDLELTMHEMINDGLMALFFFVVGLELKREIVVGELSQVRKAILPIMAAVGGMIVPAAIYLAINSGGPGLPGWGVPMATDIAFALGILALLGSRVPPALKVFVTALAIADDLGAILVIAVFYTPRIEWPYAFMAIGLLLLMVVLGRLRVRRVDVYFVLALGVWVAVLLLGVHATVAGILIALTIPVKPQIRPREFLRIGYAQLEELEGHELTTESIIHDRDQLDAVRELHEAAREMRPPGVVLEKYFHPVLVWVILPLFALFNAGVQFNENVLASLFSPVAIGIMLGLLLGKQVGITLFSWLAVKSRQANLPNGVSWRQIYGVSWLAGIGFTMSLFITSLAFDDPALINAAKMGILTASVIAGLGGYLILRLWLPAEGTASKKAAQPARATDAD